MGSSGKANAVKSAKGRRQLAIIEQNNRNVLAKSIRDAITKGEKRAQLVEFRGKKMDKDTQWLINADLKAKIAKLKDSTSKQVDALRMESAKAREQLMIEMKYAVKSAASVTKKNRALMKAQSDATLRKIQAEEARAGVALGK